MLLIGGAGSIGSQLALKLPSLKPSAIRVFDADENGLFNFELSIPRDSKTLYRLFLGDIRDRSRLLRAVEGVHIVYHFAALKHVHIGNYNPFEVVKTNILGTQNVLEAVLDAGTVEKCVFISTDKAVEPASTYGMSKLLGEQLTLSASAYRGFRKTKFCCLRFGNVIGSRGNVWHVWGQQVAKDEPLTVTDPRMRRYFIHMDDIISFILKVTPILQDGEIAIPKMKEYRVIDIARQLGTQVNIIGKREGEKLREQLLSREEMKRATSMKGYWIIRNAPS